MFLRDTLLDRSGDLLTVHLGLLTSRQHLVVFADQLPILTPRAFLDVLTQA
jgi:hypothetical protein